MQRSTQILVLVIVCAALLRFWGLDFSSLWTDELESWRQSSQPTLSGVIRELRWDVTPPAYFALLHYVIRYLGDSEWLLRLPSALAGIASVPAIYILGKALYTTREGLIGAAILTVSWAPIAYSQEARFYGLLLLLGIILFYYWLHLMMTFEADGKLPVTVFFGYVITAVGVCYTHYFGLQLVVLQALGFIALFVCRPPVLAKIGALYVVIFLAYLPWLATFFAQVEAHTNSWIPESTFLHALAGFAGFAFHVDWRIVWILVIPAYACAAVAGLRMLYREGRSYSARALVFSSGGLLILWAAVPFLAAFVQSVLLAPVMINRYFILLLPAVYLLLARGIAVMPLTIGRLWTGLLCLSLVLSLVLVDRYYSQPQKDQYREAAAYVVAGQGSYTGLPIVAFAWSKASFDYYLQRLGSPEKVSLIAGSMDDVGKLEQLLRTRNATGFWYLVGQRVPEAQFIETLNSHYQLVSETKLLRASARLYCVKGTVYPIPSADIAIRLNTCRASDTVTPSL